MGPNNVSLVFVLLVINPFNNILVSFPLWLWWWRSTEVSEKEVEKDGALPLIHSWSDAPWWEREQGLILSLRSTTESCRPSLLVYSQNYVESGVLPRMRSWAWPFACRLTCCAVVSAFSFCCHNLFPSVRSSSVSTNYVVLHCNCMLGCSFRMCRKVQDKWN